MLAKFLISGILFSTSVILELKMLVKRKPLTFGILFSTGSKSSLEVTPLHFFIVWFIVPMSVSYLVFKTNFVVSILFTFVTNPLYSVFYNIVFTLDNYNIR